VTLQLKGLCFQKTFANECLRFVRRVDPDNVEADTRVVIGKVRSCGNGLGFTLFRELDYNFAGERMVYDAFYGSPKDHRLVAHRHRRNGTCEAPPVSNHLGTSVCC
jgi:hypothetical protein